MAPNMSPKKARLKSSYVHPEDVKKLLKFVDLELEYYNHVVGILSAQLNRDCSVLSSLTPENLNSIRFLCRNPEDIYNKNPSKWSTTLDSVKDDLSQMTSFQRFIVNELIKRGTIPLEVKVRMLSGLLNFFVNQAKNKQRVESKNVPSFSVSYHHENLSTQTSYNKRHVQLPREICKIEKDIDNDLTLIWTPYTKHPVSISGSHHADQKNWNYIVLRQVGDVLTFSSDWAIELNRISDNDYLTKRMDRFGKSSIFELSKNRR